MKRLLATCMMLLLLAGCARTDVPPPEESDPPRVAAPVPEQTPAEDLTAPEGNVPETDPVETAPATQPETVPVSKPATKPVSQPAPAEPTSEPAETPKVDPEASEALMIQAAELYREITEDKVFGVQVTEPDGTVTELTVTPGVNDGNVASRAYTLQSYEWTAASAEDWQTLTASENRGAVLRFVGAEGQSLTCCSGGDVVELVRDGAASYARAVNPREGELFEYTLYGALGIVVQDALRDAAWRVTVDGSLSPREAAEQMTQQIAEHLRNAPDWADWTPLDARAGDVSVFDIYWGDPAEFCFNMALKLRFDNPMTGPAWYWQAGAGLSELEETGWYGCGYEVWVKKNDAGDWVYMERGTGGASVRSDFRYDTASLAKLVELFCLTEGRTHDLFVPYEILDRSAEELADLPALLDQLTEAEGRELCAVLGRCLREHDYWDHSVETLKPLLGPFGDWLDA